MKYLVDVFVIIVVFFLLGACSRTTEREEAIKNYWDNRELFHDAVEICQKNSELEPSTIISDWKIQENFLKTSNPTEIEKKTLKKLIQLNCQSLYFDNEKQCIRFSIPNEHRSYQGIFVFTSEEGTPDIEIFLREWMPYEKDIEYEKLEERVYYYNYSGDRPTQSDPGTINGVPLESLPD